MEDKNGETYEAFIKDLVTVKGGGDKTRIPNEGESINLLTITHSSNTLQELWKYLLKCIREVSKVCGKFSQGTGQCHNNC